MRFHLLFIFFFCSFFIEALTVKSVLHDDWSNPLTWNTGQVPAAPDTIIIDSYVTFSSNLTIQAPTVLIVDSIGTLCGDFQLDVSCGAKAYNYGYIYVNSAIVRDMWNYNRFWSKNYVNIMGCGLPGCGNGYSNVPPSGTTAVWPPVLCRTSGTNWFGATAIAGISSNDGTSIYPNPFKETITIEQFKYTTLTIKDVLGRIRLKQAIKDQTMITLDCSFLEEGIYFIELQNNNSSFIRRIAHI